MDEVIAGARPVAIRLANAHAHFIGLCGERGFTVEQAEHILAVYMRLKAVTLNVAMGRYDVRHGGFLEVEVMRNALDVPA